MQAAERLLEDAAARLNDLPPDSGARLIYSIRRSKLALKRDDPRAARDAIQPTIDLFEARGMRGAVLAIALELRSESEHRLGNESNALRDAEMSLAITQRIQGSRPHSLLTGQSWLQLARLKREGDVAGSREAAQNTVAHLSDMLGDEHRDTQSARKLAVR